MENVVPALSLVQGLVPAKTPSLESAKLQTPEPAQKYIGVKQAELDRHIISNTETLTYTNIIIKTIFNELLASIKIIKEKTNAHLQNAENLNSTDNNKTFLEIIKEHLQKDTSHNFQHITHKLNFKCYKKTLTDINNADSNNLEKRRIDLCITNAFAIHTEDATVHNIKGETQNTVNCFIRNVQQVQNKTRWNNIPTNNSKVKPSFHTVNTISTAYNNKPNTNNDNCVKVQKYITNCDIHQQSYNAKHNELIKLFNVLQIILKHIIKIIQIIDLISKINKVNNKSTIAKFVVKIPKKLLNDNVNVNDYEKLEKSLTDVHIPNDQPEFPQLGGYNNMKGGGNNAPLPLDNNNLYLDTLFDEKAITNMPAHNNIVLSTKFEIKQTSDTNTNYSLTIPESEKEHFKNAKQLKITQTLSSPPNNKTIYTFKVSSTNENNNLLNLILQKKENIFNVQNFNDLNLIQQSESINIVKLGIKYKYTAGIMQSIAYATTSILQNSITNATSKTQFIEVTNGNVQPEKIECIDAHVPRIENILLRCYDLQALYLIKYFEIIALIKYIIRNPLKK